MKNRHQMLPVLGVLVLGVSAAGCQPQTPAEHIQEGAEDAAHETEQMMDRAGDRIEDATDND